MNMKLKKKKYKQMLMFKKMAKVNNQEDANFKI